MAISDITSQGDTSQKNTTKPKEKKARPPTKVVVRRLPPDMNKDTFLDQISPISDYDYLYIVKGDNSLGEYSFSRAYINFVNIEDIFIFKEKFDNYVFIDQKGHEYPAVVEFAAFQKIPKKRRARPDPKCATIESDPYYQEFLESLKEQPKRDEKPEYSYQFASETKEVNTTPLLEYVKQKKLDKQRIREERREERRKREIERKKYKEEERKKYLEEKHKSVPKSFTSSLRPVKTFTAKTKKDKMERSMTEENDDDLDNSFSEIPQRKNETTDTEESKVFFKNNRKFYGQDKDKSNYYEKKDYRYRKDDYRDYAREKSYGSSKKYDKYEELKKNSDYERQYSKKVKKYSAIREERKNEIKKQEQKKIEPEPSKPKEAEDSKLETGKQKQEAKEGLDEPTSSKVENEKSKESKPEKAEAQLQPEQRSSSQSAKENFSQSETNNKEKESKNTNKENDPRVQRRIRNKDRPTMAIYQPGMLSKRKQIESSESTKISGEEKT